MHKHITTVLATFILLFSFVGVPQVSAQSVAELKAMVLDLQQQLLILQNANTQTTPPVLQSNTSDPIYQQYRDYYGESSFRALYGVDEGTPTFQPQVVSAPTPTVAAGCTLFTQTLGAGSSDATTGGQVTRLQTLLRAGGFYTYPEITGYYGVSTQGAVERYQAARGIASSGTPDSNGFGLVGPQTRVRLNQDHCARTASQVQTQNNVLVESDVTLSEDDFESELVADRERYKPGDTIYFSAFLENNSRQTIDYDCDTFTIESSKLRLQASGDEFCFGTGYLEPGQRVTFTRNITIPESVTRDGRFEFEATFPGGFTSKENLYIEQGELSVEITLNDDTFRPGDIIEIAGAITNETTKDLVYDPNLCPVLRVEIDGVPEEITGNTEECYSYLDQYNYYGSYFQSENVAKAGFVTTLRHNYQIPADFTGEGNYDVEVTFPGGFTKTEKIYIGANDPAVEVEMTTDKNAYTRGETIEITGTLTNRSDQEISISSQQYGPSCGYLFVTVNGVVDTRPVNCSTSTFLIDRLRKNQSGDFGSDFQIPTDSAVGDTTITVIFPGGNSVSKDITIQ